MISTSSLLFCMVQSGMSVLSIKQLAQSMNHVVDTEEPAWLIRNYGPRCTLVCAASILQKLGASPEGLVRSIEQSIGFTVRMGPSAHAYLGKDRLLDRAIEKAASISGISVRANTRLFVARQHIVSSLRAGVPVILNCFRSPSCRWSHSVLAVDYDENGRLLLTLDPNDASYTWMTWGRPHTGWICTATFVEH